MAEDEKYKNKYEVDQKIYGSLSEQEDEEEEPEEEIEEEEPEEEIKEEEPEDDVGEQSSEAFGVSFDSVITAINALRAGRSLKDSSIKQQASAYYDKLDDNERGILLLFLKELSKILSGSLQGSEAADPSEDPYGFSVNSDDDKEEIDIDDEEGVEEEPEEEAEEPEDEDVDNEDTTPPIRVSESKRTSKLRKKIRDMMLRG